LDHILKGFQADDGTGLGLTDLMGQFPGLMQGAAGNMDGPGFLNGEVTDDELGGGIQYGSHPIPRPHPQGKKSGGQPVDQFTQFFIRDDPVAI
jgi:hypothetical protein